MGDKGSTADQAKAANYAYAASIDRSDTSRAEILGGHGEENAMEAAARIIEEAKSGKADPSYQHPHEGEFGTGGADA